MEKGDNEGSEAPKGGVLLSDIHQDARSLLIHTRPAGDDHTSPGNTKQAPPSALFILTTWVITTPDSYVLDA